MSNPHFLAVFLLLAGLSAPGYAQEGKPSAPAAPAKPEPAKSEPAKPAPKSSLAKPAPVTSTTYGDWALRCRPGGKGGARLCEVSQTIEAPDQSGPIAKISVGRPNAGDALHAVVILPNNVSFPSSVHIFTDDKDKWGFELNWQRCIPGGCFADATLADATVTHWHGLNTVGKIVFKDSAGDEITLPMTFQGFGAALDALNK